MDIPDAFHSPFQAHPLDRHSDHFYQARKSEIDARIEEIGDMSEEVISHAFLAFRKLVQFYLT